MKIRIGAVAALLGTIAVTAFAAEPRPASGGPQDPKVESAAAKIAEPKISADQAALEQAFSEMCDGAILTGRFTNTQTPDPGKLAEEKYEIASATKIAGSLWTINTRIVYGGHDVTVPIPVVVEWAGKSPVIVLDKTPVPGLGTFSARVIFHDGKYAGLWDAGDHGGHLFGTFAKAEKNAAEKKAAEKK